MKTLLGSVLILVSTSTLANAISGTVTGPSGVPVTQGVVRARASSGPSFVESMVLDSSGQYLLGGLPDGDYVVEFDSSGQFRDLISELFDDIQCPGGLCDRAQATVISLTGGATATADAQLAQGNSIAGIVTGPDGTPVTRGIVDAFDASTLAFVGSSSLSDLGQYRIRDLLDGDYRLVFRTFDEGDFSELVDELYDDIPCPGRLCDLSQGTVVSLADGTAAAVDAQLAEGNTIAGTVTGPAGEAVPLGAATILNALTLDVVRLLVDFDSNGQYRAVGLPDGDYLVLLRGFGGFADLVDELYEDIPCSASSCDFAQGTVISLTSAMTATVDAQLAAGNSVSGAVTGPNGIAVTRGAVDVIDSSTLNIVETVSLDSNGQYRVGGLSDGGYLFVFRSFSIFDNLVDELFDDIPCPIRGCVLSQGTVTSLSGGSAVTVDAQLARGNSLTGTVTNSSGAPVSEGIVAAYAETGLFVGASNFATNGFYAIPGLPPGSYYVTFDAFGAFSNLADELYDDLLCPDGVCDLSRGTPVIVTASDVGGVDAQLDVIGERLFSDGFE